VGTPYIPNKLGYAWQRLLLCPNLRMLFDIFLWQRLPRAGSAVLTKLRECWHAFAVRLDFWTWAAVRMYGNTSGVIPSKDSSHTVAENRGGTMSGYHDYRTRHRDGTTGNFCRLGQLPADREVRRGVWSGVLRMAGQLQRSRLPVREGTSSNLGQGRNPKEHGVLVDEPL